MVPDEENALPAKDLDNSHTDNSHTTLSPTTATTDTSHLNARDQERLAQEATLTDQTNILPPKQLIIVFLALSSCVLVSLMDQTIVATALPVIARELPGTIDSSWIATAYLLTSTCCQPLYGRFSDIFGRKPMLLTALTIFMAGSAGCGAAQDRLQLIITRAIAGIGGGGLFSLVMITVSDIVSLKDRGKYQGILAAVMACATALGPPLGGIFSDDLSWRWGFFINLPIGAFSALVVILVLPRKRTVGDRKSKFARIDYPGSLTIMIATALIVLPITWGGNTYAWASAPVLITACLAVVAIASFVYLETTTKKLPILPFNILKTATVIAIFISSALNGMGYYIQLFYLPQYLQVVHQYSARSSGLFMIPLLASQTFFSFVAGLLVSRLGEYVWNIRAGYVIWAIGAGLITSLDATTSIGLFIVYLVICGMGSGQTGQVTVLVALQASVPKKDMAVATAGRSFIRTLGGTIGLAIAASILNNTVLSHVPLTASQLASPTDAVLNPPSNVTSNEVIAAYLAGLRNVFRFCLGCVVACFLLSMVIKAYSLTEPGQLLKRGEGRKKKSGNGKGNKVVEEMKVSGGDEGRMTVAAEDTARGEIAEDLQVPVSENETVVQIDGREGDAGAGKS
ncbi:hypothetical protein HKX48_003287 [Thoreauomyces humboldtii]|nr:hypothetical protein HKX48_003287 [Thoreauomyces humboldtii]